MKRKTVNTRALLLCLFTNSLIAVTILNLPYQRCSANATISDTYISVIKDIKPSMVNIRTAGFEKRETQTGKKRNSYEDGYHHKRMPYKQTERMHDTKKQGSGVIADGKGHIITNNHIVQGASELTVKLFNGREYKAKIAGADPKTDIAILKIDVEDLKPATFGNSNTVQVGEIVLAAGCPFGMEQLVTKGIISAKGSANVRYAEYANFLQTDATISPGNTGGPLLNLRGEVIGINTTIVTQADGAYSGINFAVPVNNVLEILNDVLKHGEVRRGWLGITAQAITPQLQDLLKLKDNQGVLISDVEPASPAAATGIKSGDIIIKYGGKKITDLFQLRNLVTNTEINTEVEIDIIRDDEELTLKATILKRSGNKGKDTLNNLGLTVQTLTQELADNLKYKKEEKGVVITNVEISSPAFEAKLRAGDLIIEAYHTPVASTGDLLQTLSKNPQEDGVLMLIKHLDGTVRYAVLKVK